MKTLQGVYRTLWKKLYKKINLDFSSNNEVWLNKSTNAMSNHGKHTRANSNETANKWRKQLTKTSMEIINKECSDLSLFFDGNIQMPDYFWRTHNWIMNMHYTNLFNDGLFNPKLEQNRSLLPPNPHREVGLRFCELTFHLFFICQTDSAKTRKY